MAEIIKIDNSYLRNYTSGLHAQFHQRQYALVSGEDTRKLNIPDTLMAEWRRLIDLEISINREAQASVDTARMRKKDEERDKMVSYIFNTVSTERQSPDDASAEAAERLAVALRPYRGLQDEGFDTESLHIVGLLEDLGKLSAQVEALRLTAAVAKLKALNDEYMALREGRTAERADTKLPNSKTVRPQTDEAFQSVCAYIEATHLLSQDTALKAAIETLVRRMNQLSAELRTSYRQSQAQKGNKTGSSGSLSPDPSPIGRGDDDSSSSADTGDGGDGDNTGGGSDGGDGGDNGSGSGEGDGSGDNSGSGSGGGDDDDSIG